MNTSQQLVRDVFDLHPSVSHIHTPNPLQENIFDDFSCALQKTVAVHGRLYITDSFLCFYSNVLGLEQKVGPSHLKKWL